MAKGKSWAGAEDECLCHAWLRASEVSITGTGQKRTHFGMPLWGISSSCSLLVNCQLLSIACHPCRQDGHSSTRMQQSFAPWWIKFTPCLGPAGLMICTWTRPSTALQGREGKQPMAQNSASCLQFFFMLQGTYTPYQVGAYMVDDPVSGKFLQGQVMSTLYSIYGMFWHTYPIFTPKNLRNPICYMTVPRFNGSEIQQGMLRGKFACSRHCTLVSVMSFWSLIGMCEPHIHSPGAFNVRWNASMITEPWSSLQHPRQHSTSTLWSAISLQAHSLGFQESLMDSLRIV